jgi:hypothetical protein
MRPLLFILLLFPIYIFGQDTESDLPFYFSAGAQMRVTPIYLKKVPDYIITSETNVHEQPDEYLSGTVCFHYSIEKKLVNSFSVKFSHSIRYGTVYRTLNFTSLSPNQYVKPDIRKAFISDLYFDIQKEYQLNSSSLKFGLGVIMAGLGTSYTITERFVGASGQNFYLNSRKNFQFTAASLTIDWQKNRFDAWLRIGYCKNNTTIFKIPFLFPELGIEYRLFSFQFEYIVS